MTTKKKKKKRHALTENYWLKIGNIFWNILGIFWEPKAITILLWSTRGVSARKRAGTSEKAVKYDQDALKYIPCYLFPPFFFFFWNTAIVGPIGFFRTLAHAARTCWVAREEEKNKQQRNPTKKNTEKKSKEIIACGIEPTKWSL